MCLLLTCRLFRSDLAGETVQKCSDTACPGSSRGHLTLTASSAVDTFNVRETGGHKTGIALLQLPGSKRHLQSLELTHQRWTKSSFIVQCFDDTHVTLEAQGLRGQLGCDRASWPPPPQSAYAMQYPAHLHQAQTCRSHTPSLLV